MDRLVGLFLVVLAVSVLLSPLAASSGSEEKRGYIGGGSLGGARMKCTPELDFDILAACDVRCPGGTCNIRVLDEYYQRVYFRICFEGESLCRPMTYIDTADVPGERVTVVPGSLSATRGVVIVR